METKVTVQIAYTDPLGKKTSEKISYVNPEATNQQIREFALKLMALTDNTYTSATKITEEKI